MGKTQTTGNSGEEMTANFLKGRGYIISARNYHSRFGEIDVIAENNEMILFVEVKTRSVKSKILPREFVDKEKQRKIRITAGGKSEWPGAVIKFFGVCNGSVHIKDYGI